MKASRAGILIASLPGVVMLGMFYSLAMHMYFALGGWPAAIGENGFPPALVTHAGITMRYFGALTLTFLFGLPVAALICALVSRWDFIARYLAVFGFSCIVSCGLMMLAPAGFSHWWQD